LGLSSGPKGEAPMFEDSEAVGPECSICLQEHDDQIHAATLSIHQWWREQVTRYFYEEGESTSDSPAAA